MTYTALLFSIALILANGFFVAAEFALIGSKQIRLETLAEDGSRRAAWALRSVRQLNTQLAAAQLGITVCSLALGSVGEPVVAGLLEGLLGGVLSEDLLHLVAFPVALVIVAYFHMLMGEMVPKGLAIADPERACLWLAGPLRAVAVIGFPLIWFLNLLASGVLRLFGRTAVDELETGVSARELQLMFAESRRSGQLDSEEHERLSRVLGFRDVSAATVMIERSEIISLQRSVSVADAQRRLFEGNHTRLPVYGADLDDVLGFIHGKDLLNIPQGARNEPVPGDKIRPMIRLAPQASLPEMLRAMRLARTHLGIVVEEGRTLGLVTLDDVLSRLVGSIGDQKRRAKLGA